MDRPSLDQFFNNTTRACKSSATQPTTLNRPSMSNSPMSESITHTETEARQETKLRPVGRVVNLAASTSRHQARAHAVQRKSSAPNTNLTAIARRQANAQLYYCAPHVDPTPLRCRLQIDSGTSVGAPNSQRQLDRCPCGGTLQKLSHFLPVPTAQHCTALYTQLHQFGNLLASNGDCIHRLACT